MSDLNNLIDAFDDILNEFPGEKRKLVEQAGEKMHRQVLKNIDTDTKEKTGNLRRACQKEIGSGGGYAAVRNSHIIAPHAHLVENGHKMVSADGKVIGWVNGKHMYRNAMNTLENELEQDAERLMEKIVGGKF